MRVELIEDMKTDRFIAGDFARRLPDDSMLSRLNPKFVVLDMLGFQVRARKHSGDVDVPSLKRTDQRRQGPRQTSPLLFTRNRGEADIVCIFA